MKVLSFYDTRHDEGSEGSDETIFDDAITSLSIEEKTDFFQKSVIYLKQFATRDKSGKISLEMKACILRALPYLNKILKNCISGEQDDLNLREQDLCHAMTELKTLFVGTWPMMLKKYILHSK